MTHALALILAYLAGSIPFGLLLGFARGVDIRQHGSKNIGATNAGRVLGKKWGLFAFALDFLKGLLPVVIAGLALGCIWRTRDGAPPSAANSWWWIGVAAAAVLGHVFPVWLRLKGGKGVATGFGAMLGLFPFVTYPAGVALVVWIVTVKLTRYVSVASIAAALVLPLAVAGFAAAGLTTTGGTVAERLGAAAPFLLTTALMGILVIWRHRANLARLRAGTENKIGGASPAAAR